MICNIHKLFSSLLSISLSLLLLPSLPPSERASALLQCISEKIALSTPLGDDSQRATYFPSTTNMQLSPKVDSVPYQVLGIVSFVGMLSIQGTDINISPPMLLWAFYGSALNQVQKSKNMWTDIVGGFGKMVFFFFQGHSLSSSIDASVHGWKKPMGKMQNGHKRHCFGTTQAHSRLEQAFKVFIQFLFSVAHLHKYNSTKFLWIQQV